ncbi:MAG TPA: hypothetical protein ENJ95_17590, partial [Bacteroidetes bacterium]|nr:hypothetical protein [Bacteroidota bacterium]
MKFLFSRTKGLPFSLLLLFSVFNLAKLSACDTSGNIIQSAVDNCDGTYTIVMDVLVAGGITTGVGSTWGFWWMADAPILSVDQMSLTSMAGVTINAVITGNTVTWGDPEPSAATPFVDINVNFVDELFTVTVVLGALPTVWNSGGYEGNNCPGGNGTSPPNYMGEFCFTPAIMATPNEITICPGDLTTLEAVTCSATEVTWEPGGLVGNSVEVSPTVTTEYTVTASNACDQASITYTVNVIPLPTIEAVDEEIEVCEGTPAIMEVIPANENIVTWSPTGTVGTLVIETPTSSPMVYTATASNQCGEESTDITVTILPFPTVEMTGNSGIICSNDTLTLTASATNAATLTWQPGNIDGPTIEVSPSSTTTYTVSAFNDCGIDMASTTVEVGTSEEMEINLEACTGETVLFNGIPLSAGTSSTFTYETFTGCDSVVTVNVAELTAPTNNITLQACAGQTASYNGLNLAPGTVTDFTLQAANGCDSVVTVTVDELPAFASSLSISVCAGTNATYAGQSLAPGTTTDFVLPSANGCDSVVTVTVDDFPAYNLTENLQTCTGVPILYNGQNLAPGSSTSFNFTSVNGCDSIVTVEVEELAAFTSAVNLEACTGSSATYAGLMLAPNTITDFTLTSANGCDSIVTVTVSEVAVITETLSFDACTGETVSFNGQILPAGSSTDFPFTTQQGCDSILTVVVNELPTYNTALQLQACTGTTVMYNGVELAAGTTTDVPLSSFSGCDSIVSVTVNELQNVTATLSLSACTGSTATFNGQALATGSSTDFTFQSYLGCDSILTVTVEELETYSEPLSLRACTGSTVTYNGIELSPGTTVGFTLTATNGCDSVVLVTVTETETIEETLELAACSGSTAQYNGQALVPGSSTEFTFQTADGCDSIVTVTVEELEVVAENIELAACAGSTVLFNGTQLAPGSSTEFSFVTSQGCDSILTVVVEELEVFSSPLQLQACTGTTVSYNGLSLLPGSTTDVLLTAINGCDSLVTVTVEEVNTITESMSLSACEGASVLFNGMQLAAGSSTDFVFTSSQGCDSILTVTVEELPNQSSALQMEACEGSSVTYNGQALAAGSVTDILLSTFNGCDSVVTVTVEELLNVSSSISLQECENVPLMYQGTEIAPGTSMDFTFTSALGCDSIVTVIGLEPLSIIETFEEVEVCEGETAIIFGQPISTPGLYSQSFAGANGCDSTHSVLLNFTDDLLLDFDGNITTGLGEPVRLQPIVNPFSALAFDWEPDPTLSCLDCQNPLASPLNTTTYTLTITNELDCTATANVTVLVRKERNIYIPNSFSPNDDGINDVFMIFSGENDVKNVNSFFVFSRW